MLQNRFALAMETVATRFEDSVKIQADSEENPFSTTRRETEDGRLKSSLSVALNVNTA